MNHKRAFLRGATVDLPLLLIIILGFTLRVVGLHWGLPGAEHYHSYHPDEVIMVSATANVNPLAGDFDPGFYNYGSLTFFVLRIAYDLSAVIAPPGAEDWAMLARVILLGRLLAILLGAATILLTYNIGRRLGGRYGGIAAATILAIAPGHVAHSHYLAVDVPATFWTAAALSAALRLLDAPRFGMAVLAGICAGFAAATKYNAGLVLLAPLAAVILHAQSWRTRLALLATCVGAGAAAFLCGCPGVLLNTPLFLRDILYEARHVQTGHGLLFEKTLPGWIYHLVVSLRFALGIPLLLVTLAGAARAMQRRFPANLVVAAWVVPYYLLIGFAQVKFLRYVLPLLPPLAAWAGAACADCLAGVRFSRWRALAATALVGIAFWSLAGAIAYDVLFAAADPRDRAAAWIRSNVPAGATLGLLNIPWFYTPPLVPWNGNMLTRQAFEEARPQWPYAFRAGNWTAQRVEQEQPECFVVSDLEVRDALRLQHADTRAFLATLTQRYRRHVFRPQTAWPGLFGPGYPPEDWLYPAPTITVYYR